MDARDADREHSFGALGRDKETSDKSWETAVVLSVQGTPGLAQSYDRRGQLSTVVRGDTTTTLSYNNAGQLLGEGYAGGILDGLSVTNYYDALLRRTNVSTLGAGVLSSDSYGYDWASRLMTATNESGDSAKYTYLANSPLIQQITFKNAGTTRMTTTKQYDFLNRLTKISSTPSSGTPNSSAYEYNQANQRIRNVQADGSYWRYQYDAFGQVTSGIKYWPDQEPVAGQQFGYTFDTIGNRRSSKAGGDAAGGKLRSADYAVNALNEITSLSVTGAVDVMGLALATSSVTVNGQTPYRKGEYFRKEISVSNGSNPAWQSATVAAPGETSVTGNAYVPKTPEQFAYDADGNLTSDGRWTYVWDAENRLVQMLPTTVVTVPDGAKRKLDFVYDYKSCRIQKAVSTWNGADWSLTVSNRFLYDGWNLVAELNATNNAVIRTYLWGLDLSGSLQGAGGVGGLLAISDASKGRHFVSYDGNGNVMRTADSTSGTASATYEYGPFGELLRATGPMAKANPFRFSTKYQDDETDLLYYGYRYYNASMGRWNSRDPISEWGGYNLYAFVKNEPCSHVDARGRIPIEGPGPVITHVCPTCRCKKVKVGPPTNIESAGGGYPYFPVGLAVPITIEVQGDPKYCKCKHIDGGKWTWGTSEPRHDVNYDPNDPKNTHYPDCKDYTDHPGFGPTFMPFPPGTPWSGQHDTYHFTYNMQITVTCEDSDGGQSIQDSSPISGDFRFDVTFSTPPIITPR